MFVVSFRWILTIVLIYNVYLCSGKTFRIAWLAPGADSKNEITSGTSVGALKLALKSVSKNAKILKGHTIGVKYFQISCNAQSAMMTAMFAKKSYNPDVIIGPPCDEAMKMVAQLGAFWNLPVFSWRNTRPRFGNTVDFPTLIRMTPSLKIMGESLLHVLRQHNWKKFSLIYDGRSEWVDLKRTIKATVLQTDLRVLSSHMVNNTISDDGLIQLFSQIKNYASIIVFACPGELVRRYLLAASRLGMANGNFVFIQLDHEVHPDAILKNIVLSDGSWSRGDPHDEEARRITESLIKIVIDPMNDDTEPTHPLPRSRYKEFARLAMGKMPNNPDWVLPSGGKPDVYSLYLYDAILVWSVLVDQLQKSGKDYRDGKLMAETVKLFFAEGATGYIAISKDLARIGKVFVLDMASDGNFKPVQILRFNSSNGYHLLNVTPAAQMFRWGNGKVGPQYTPADTPVTSTTAFAEIKNLPGRHRNPGRTIPSTSTISTPSYTVTSLITTAASITTKARTNRRIELQPTVKNTSMSKQESIRASKLTNIVAETPKKSQIHVILARLKALEKVMVNTINHDHSNHIPDHSHTPHPLLALRTTAKPVIMPVILSGTSKEMQHGSSALGKSKPTEKNFGSNRVKVKQSTKKLTEHQALARAQEILDSLRTNTGNAHTGDSFKIDKAGSPSANMHKSKHGTDTKTTSKQQIPSNKHVKLVKEKTARAENDQVAHQKSISLALNRHYETLRPDQVSFISKRIPQKPHRTVPKNKLMRTIPKTNERARKLPIKKRKRQRKGRKRNRDKDKKLSEKQINDALIDKISARVVDRLSGKVNDDLVALMASFNAANNGGGILGTWMSNVEDVSPEMAMGLHFATNQQLYGTNRQPTQNQQTQTLKSHKAIRTKTPIQNQQLFQAEHPVKPVQEQSLQNQQPLQNHQQPLQNHQQQIQNHHQQPIQNHHQQPIQNHQQQIQNRHQQPIQNHHQKPTQKQHTTQNEQHLQNNIPNRPRLQAGKVHLLFQKTQSTGPVNTEPLPLPNIAPKPKQQRAPAVQPTVQNGGNKTVQQILQPLINIIDQLAPIAPRQMPQRRPMPLPPSPPSPWMVMPTADPLHDRDVIWGQPAVQGPGMSYGMTTSSWWEAVS